MYESEINATFLGGRVRVLVGDITEQHVDAIVNAANAELFGGGGVDGAIHEAGGSQIFEECRRIRSTTHPRGLAVGEAVITSAGNLPAKYVIHTVGPVKGVWGDRDSEKLASCYLSSLALALNHGVRSIAFPAISTGIYRYPREEAAVIVSETLTKALLDCPAIVEIRLIFYSARDATVFLQNHRFPPA